MKEADLRRLVDRIVAVASADDRILIRGFWHDVDHLTTALGRGNTWWAYGQLGELRQMVINLARIEAGAQPDDEAYWKVDETVPEHRLAALRATVAQPELGPMRTAAVAMVELYREIAVAWRHATASTIRRSSIGS